MYRSYQRTADDNNGLVVAKAQAPTFHIPFCFTCFVSCSRNQSGNQSFQTPLVHVGNLQLQADLLTSYTGRYSTFCCSASQLYFLLWCSLLGFEHLLSVHCCSTLSSLTAAVIRQMMLQTALSHPSIWLAVFVQMACSVAGRAGWSGQVLWLAGF